MIRLALATALLLGRLTSPEVRGIVRVAESSERVANALIEVVGVGRATRSDSTGSYVLSERLPPGRLTLRFSRIGYETLTVDVYVPDDAPLTVDVSLSPQPVEIAPVRVVANAVSSRNASTGSLLGSEPGAWSLSGEGLRRTPLLGEAGGLRALVGSPQVHMLAEQPTTLHVRGGSADQNLILLDGIPIYNPVHSGEIFSALNPDVIDGLVLHGAVPAAQYGGRLSGVVDVQTRDFVPQVLTTRGTFGMTAGHATVEFPLTNLRGAVTLSGRHSYRGIAEQLDQHSDGRGQWADFFAKSSLKLSGNDLRVFSFFSADRLSFASSGSEVADEGSLGQPGADGDARDEATAVNHFRWSTEAHGLVWRRPAITNGSLETRVWQSRVRINAGWETEQHVLQLRNSMAQVGLTSLLSRPKAGGHATAGFSLEQLTSDYVVSARNEDPASVYPGKLLRRSAAPLLASFFFQEPWALSDRWTLGTGMRVTVLNGARTFVEPRQSIIFAPNRRVVLSAGYARAHQFTQSLRNEESIVDAIVGIDLPLAVGRSGVPVAQADELAARAKVAAGRRTSVSVDGYARSLRGLLIVASTTAEPFATDSFSRGAGKVRGLGVEVAHETDRLSLQGTYTLASVTRTVGQQRYRPGFAPTHAASLAAGYLLFPGTRIRAAASASAGRPTTPVRGALELEWRDPLYRDREISGSPRGTLETPGASRLPLYLRIDAGIRHDFTIRRPRTLVSAFLNVENVALRRNVLAYWTTEQAAGRRSLIMLPISTTFGFDWRF